MKKFNPGAIICSVVILICACSCSVMSVSGLSAQGKDILSDLASVGTSLGIDIGDYVSTSETTTVNQTSAPQAEEQLGELLSGLGVKLDILSVTDMVSYLNSGKSFVDWIYDNYGDTVDIPESVRTMSTKDVILYLLGTALYPTESTAGTTNGDYVFVPSETHKADETTTRKTEIETQSKTNIVIYPSNETMTSRKTGDVNDDGKITAADARLILRAAAGIQVLSGDAADAADVNGDSVITAKDARSVLRYAAGITKSF